MILEKIDLYQYFGEKRRSEKAGFLRAYRHGKMTEMPERLRPAMLLIPGGAYLHVAEREGEPPALWYFQKGFDVFILEYDTAPFCYPTQILQAGMAMLYLRREVQNLGLRPDKIVALGFSAGGHLCGCISFLWDDQALFEKFGDECERIRPDAAILSYAVVTSDEKYTHKGSFENFCGKAVKAEEYSLEKKIRPSAPPCFLWATTEDACVPVENSVLLYMSLHRAKVPAELHIFEKGGHGLADCSKETAREPMGPVAHAGHWMELSLEFLESHGISF